MTNVAIVITDIVGVCGAASVAYGAWAIYHPLGFIVGGLLAMAGALLVSRPAPENDPGE